MNNLNDLNEILFSQIRKLENDDLTDEQLDREIRKSESITKTATVILKNAELALDAQKQFDEYGTGRTVDIPLLGISNEGLMVENKNLRRRLAQKEARYE
ncbi:MAG: hypothetical protein IKF42_06355 [Mogibacterium sp.]|nr:hypothetical protein [Mogibacterium sp.]